MKKNLILSTICMAVFMLLQGCTLVTPQPITDDNARGVPVPMHTYGDITLFEELRAPLQVSVRAEEPALLNTMKKYLQQSDVNCTAPGAPFDIQVNVNSMYTELTPAPKCRLSNTTIISVSAPDGTKISEDWKKKTANQQAFATADIAKAKLKPMIAKNIKLWEQNYFRKEAGGRLNVAILRFKMSKSWIELNPIQFEKDIMEVNKNLRKIENVADVRMIEVDKATRIVSFRILCIDYVNFKKALD
jgi:hypothetical protein